MRVQPPEVGQWIGDDRCTQRDGQIEEGSYRLGTLAGDEQYAFAGHGLGEGAEGRRRRDRHAQLDRGNSTVGNRGTINRRQGVPKRDVDVDGACWGLHGCGPSLGSNTGDVGEEIGVGCCHLVAPFGGVAVNHSLVDRLRSPNTSELRGTVGREHDQWNPGKGRFVHSRRILGGGRPRGANQHGGQTGELGGAKRKEGGRPLVDVNRVGDGGLVGNGNRQRGIARSGGDRRMANTQRRQGAGESVREEIVRVGHGWENTGMSATLIPVVGTGPLGAVGLHGFTQTGGMWREVATMAGIGMVAPDLPGHGTSWPGESSWTAAVAAATGVMGRPPRVLVGYSQGARVALGAALAAPESVRRLVVISGRPGLEDEDARQARAASDSALADEIESEGVPAFVSRWLAGPMFEGLRRRPADWQQADRALRLVNKAAGLAAALRGYGLGSMPYLGDRLGELKMPVTLMAGSEDPEYVTAAERMAELLPSATVRLIHGAGHAVVGERPEEVAAVLEDLAGQ